MGVFLRDAQPKIILSDFGAISLNDRTHFIHFLHSLMRRQLASPRWSALKSLRKKLLRFFI